MRYILQAESAYVGYVRTGFLSPLGYLTFGQYLQDFDGRGGGILRCLVLGSLGDHFCDVTLTEFD